MNAKSSRVMQYFVSPSRWAMIAVVASLAASAVNAPAENAPSTAPEKQQSSTPTEEKMKQRRRDVIAGRSEDVSAGGERVRRGAASVEQNSEEWESAVKAIRTHAPNWWKRFERIPEDVPRRQRMMRLFVDRFHELQRVAQRDPEQYQREIDQIELEDEILGLTRDVVRRPPPDQDKLPELKKALRAKVEELVEMRIRNREYRIERIAKTLETERERLDKEKDSRDAAVEKQYNALLNGQSLPGLNLPAGPGADREGGARPVRPEPPANTAASPVAPATKSK